MLIKVVRVLFCLCVWLSSAATGDSQAPSPVKEIRIAAGKSADLWLGVNVSGKLFYSIATRDGNHKMKMWWIIQPPGRVTQLGTLQGSGSLKIPDLLKASLSAKLRGSATSDAIVYIRENVKIDNTVTFHW
jgi:hypothetical protein